MTRSPQMTSIGPSEAIVLLQLMKSSEQHIPIRSKPRFWRMREGCLLSTVLAGRIVALEEYESSPFSRKSAGMAETAP